MSVLTVFGRNDLLQIRRDTMMVGVFFGPLAYACALWFVPPLTRFAASSWGFGLTPYHPLIVSAFVVLGPSIVLASLMGLLLLEEKDQRTLTALRVTPLPRSAYPLYRGGVTVVLVTLYTVAVLALCRLASPDVILKGIPIGLVGGLVATVTALLIAGPANNKVEGLAIGKAIGMPLVAAPLGAYFVTDSPWHYAFALIPSYWPAKALWSAWDGTTFWPYVLGGLLYNALLVLLLLHTFRHRLG